MTTFVLVHGAWGGGWSWRFVAPLLRAAGHTVYTPTLTGMGERAHLGHAALDLDVHIVDIVNVLDYEDLHDVVLVGWSYAGMVITGVAERAAERLAHLVFLDADIPADGQSRFDIETAEGRAGWEDLLRSDPSGWRVPLSIPAGALDDVLRDGAVRRWYLERSNGQCQPIRTLTTPVRLQDPAALALPRTFISCTVDVFGMYARLYGRMAAYARRTPGWRYRELPHSHFAPLTHPRAIVELLLETAQRA